MTDETREGDEPSRRERSRAHLLAERAAHLRARADAFARAATSDGNPHPERRAALQALVDDLYATADEVARIASDLEEP